MSRVGKKPIQIPKDVSVKVEEDKIMVKGAKGEIDIDLLTGVEIEIKDGIIKLKASSEENQARSFHGLLRSLIANAIEGVSNGYEKELELRGVGYKAKLQGKNLVIEAGYSHPFLIEPEDNISFEVKEDTAITIRGIRKEKVGIMAAKIRSIRKPEPYKGKGIFYKGEQIKRKVGKKAVDQM